VDRNVTCGDFLSRTLKSPPSRERGLKLAKVADPCNLAASLPTRGAWIETFARNLRDCHLRVAPTRGRGLKLYS
jgi:hypothetical protein